MGSIIVMVLSKITWGIKHSQIQRVEAPFFRLVAFPKTVYLLACSYIDNRPNFYMEQIGRKEKPRYFGDQF